MVNSITTERAPEWLDEAGIPVERIAVPEKKTESEWLPSDWLIHRGWCQGAGSEGGTGCLLTAALLTLGERSEAFGSWFRATASILHDSVTAWNDAPGRTKEEVVAVARQAEIMAGLR